MRILYDSMQSQHKTPFGCLRQDELCTIKIQIPRHCAAMKVFICMENDEGFYKEYPMQWFDLSEGYDYYTSKFFLEDCGLYFYNFKIISSSDTFFLFKIGHLTNIGVGEKWQLTCYEKHYTTPTDFQGAVMYQVFPDRFYQKGSCDLSEKLTPYSIHASTQECPNYLPDAQGIIQNNDFFGGNLRGIQEKLSYLEALHVSVLYLNPIFMGYSNHRYDTADYKRVDPMLGTEEDFVALCADAHARGMKVILDGVFSHTGCNSVYFDKYNHFGNGAYYNPDSPYRTWFQFEDYPRRYHSWWGIETLPNVNEMDPSYLDFVLYSQNSVVRHWLNLGADGYRLDVADELPDRFIQILHQVVKETKPNAIVLGEVWEDASNKCSYGVRRKYFTQSELDSVMNYPFKDSIIGFVQGDILAEGLANQVMTIAENYPRPVLDCLMNSLSTHDTMRILTVLGNEAHGLSKEEKENHRLNVQQLERAIRKEKAAAFLQFTLPGSPCIYYGDEVALEGFEDPFNRRCFPWEQMNQDLLQFYRDLTGLKAQSKLLQRGDIHFEVQAERVVCFRRELNGIKAIILVNVGPDNYSCEAIKGNVVFSSHAQVNSDTLTLESYGFVLVEQ